MFLPVPPKKNFFAQKYYKVTNKEAIVSKNIDWQKKLEVMYCSHLCVSKYWLKQLHVVSLVGAVLFAQIAHWLLANKAVQRQFLFYVLLTLHALFLAFLGLSYSGPDGVVC